MRKLASIRTISEIRPIEGADKICVYSVDGWNIVDYVDRYKVGDLCVYFEIDSFLPIRPEFEFLRERCFKRMEGQEGLRLKTIRLRGQISQGLLLPYSTVIQGDEFQLGDDVTEYLGVQKYEVAIPTELAGKVKGNFPGFIKKTDQNRCQNSGYDIFTAHKDTKYEITMKLDGTSFTGYKYNTDDSACGRNWCLQVDETNCNNSLVRMYIDSGLQSALKAYGRNIAVQGELMGPKIQGNREGLLAHKLYVFDIFDIDAQQQLSPDDRKIALQALYDNGLKRSMVEHVPIFAYNVTLAEMNINNVAELLIDAEGPSIIHPIREGKVYKSMDGQFSFKAVSNAFLLKEKD